MALDIISRIKKLGEYFNSMSIEGENGIIYVRVNFPKGWGCSEVTEHNFNVTAVKDEIPGFFYFYTETDLGVERIFDAIEYNIKFNQDAQDKVNLLREKIEQLKNIFEEEDISVLKTLEFKYKKKKEKVKKQDKKFESDEIIQEEVENVELNNNEE